MPTPAEMFREMADRIDLMNPNEFAGAVLIVPPTVSGVKSDPIAVFTVEGVPAIDHFWGSIKMRVDGAVSELQQEIAKRATGLGWR